MIIEKSKLILKLKCFNWLAKKKPQYVLLRKAFFECKRISRDFYLTWTPRTFRFNLTRLVIVFRSPCPSSPPPLSREVATFSLWLWKEESGIILLIFYYNSRAISIWYNEFYTRSRNPTVVIHDNLQTQHFRMWWTVENWSPLGGLFSIRRQRCLPRRPPSSSGQWGGRECEHRRWPRRRWTTRCRWPRMPHTGERSNWETPHPCPDQAMPGGRPLQAICSVLLWQHLRSKTFHFYHSCTKLIYHS